MCLRQYTYSLLNIDSQNLSSSRSVITGTTPQDSLRLFQFWKHNFTLEDSTHVMLVKASYMLFTIIRGVIIHILNIIPTRQ